MHNQFNKTVAANDTYVLRSDRMCTRTPTIIAMKRLNESLFDCSFDPKCIGVRDQNCNGEYTTKCYMPNKQEAFPESSKYCVHENIDRGK